MDRDEPIRVLLGEMPRLLNDIVRALVETQPDMVVVRARVPVAELGRSLKVTRPHALVVGREALAGPDAVGDLLRCRPLMRIVAIRGDGRGGTLWVMRPHRVDLEDLAPERLLQRIRGVGSRHRGGPRKSRGSEGSESAPGGGV